MVIPVMGAGPLLGPANDWHTSSGGATAAAVSADVMAVIVAVNRWTGWDEAGGEEGERRIVPFTAADEEGMREVAASVGLLLARRRGEVLLASAAPGGAAAASFAVAAVPYSVARQRLRHVARRGSKEVADVRGNLWAMRHEELLGCVRRSAGPGKMGRKVAAGQNEKELLGCVRHASGAMAGKQEA